MEYHQIDLTVCRSVVFDTRFHLTQSMSPIEVISVVAVPMDRSGIVEKVLSEQITRTKIIQLLAWPSWQDDATMSADKSGSRGKGVSWNRGQDVVLVVESWSI